MSQETGIFSVRRARETLGNINPNVSSIPMPTSTMKRSKSVTNIQQPPPTTNLTRSVSGSRMSLAPGRPSQPVFQRSSSGANLPDAGFGTAQRASTSAMLNSTSGRKSMAPIPFTPAASQTPQRRSTGYSGRQSASMGQAGRRNFFSAAPPPAGVKLDPRPLKDRAFQAEMRQELIQYMADNNFEMDMHYTLTPAALTSPSQKDFIAMFQWLYNRIDPDYKFMQKNIEAEVPTILKQLRYPHHANINKSQLTAVGGAQWPTFLGMLHWLMQTAKQVEQYDRGAYEDACLQVDCGTDVLTDRLIWDFLSGAYMAWMNVPDTEVDPDMDEVLRPHIDALQGSFNVAHVRYIEEVKALEEEERMLQDQIDELSRDEAQIEKLTEVIHVLEEDRGKFEAYNISMEARCKKSDEKAQYLDQEIIRIGQQLKEAEQEKCQLRDMVERQKLTIAEIDRMNSERERLHRSSEAYAQRLEELADSVSKREATASLQLEALQKKVQEYNSLGYKIGIIPATAGLANGKDFELQLKVNDGSSFSSSRRGQASSPEPERLLVDAVTGYQPQNLLNLDMRTTVKQAILDLRKEVNERRNAAAEDDNENKDFLDKLRDAMDDKEQEIETLKARLRNANDEYEKTRDNTSREKYESDAQIEHLERDLAQTRTSMTDGVERMVQLEMKTNLAYEALTLRAAALREELHTEVERVLNDVIRFKVHIQKNLEDYEAFVAEEVEKEVEEQEAEARREENEEGERLET